MTFSGKKAMAKLFVGDAAAFVFSLWLTLLVRYQELPTMALFFDHLQIFSGLFVLWFVVFYLSGLYSKSAVLYKGELPATIVRAQLLNVALAALLFFLVPQVGIAPKTNLFIYLVVSLLVIFLWRLWAVPRVMKPSFRERIAIMGDGPEVEELVAELNDNPRYPIRCVLVIPPAEAVERFDEVVRELRDQRIAILVVDLSHRELGPMLDRVYEVAFIQRLCRFANFQDLYEQVFDRVPLSLLRYSWFLNHLSAAPTTFYLVSKRAVDMLGGLLMGAITLAAAPFVWLLMRLEDGGPLFITQERFGQYGSPIKVYKFRSMSFNDAASSSWVPEDKKNRVTRVGNILRKSSLDEFPQCLNILRGEMSLIGPRNDIIGLGERLSEAVPYYNVRYLAKPGITGWAQVNQQYEQGNISPQSIEETKTRLAYDFYYIQHRSFGLDMLIALQTIKRLLGRVASLVR